MGGLGSGCPQTPAHSQCLSEMWEAMSELAFKNSKLRRYLPAGFSPDDSDVEVAKEYLTELVKLLSLNFYDILETSQTYYRLTDSVR